MSNQVELDHKTQQASEEVSITPSGEEILAQLGINSSTVKAMNQGIERSYYRAIINWLTKKFTKNESDLETLHPYLETLYHLCQLKKWESLQTIINVSISINPKKSCLSLPLYEYLLFKGRASTLLDVSQEILNSIKDTDINLNSVLMLKARSLSSLSNRVEDAWYLFQQICQNSLIDSEIYLEAKTHLGLSQIQLGFYQEGLEHINTTLTSIDSQRQLDLNLKIQELKADILNTLAYYEMNASHFEQAIELYKKTTTLFKTLRLDHKLIGPLVHQGIIMRRMERYEEAFNYLTEAQEKAIDINNEIDMTWINHHLAYVVLNQGKGNLAEELSKQSLEGYHKLKDKRGISDCYEQLGLINLAQGEFDKAENNFEEALKIRKSINNRHGEASSTLDLALVYWNKKKILKAIYFLLKGFKLYAKIGVLNRIRVFRMLKLAYVWTLGKRDWTM